VPTRARELLDRLPGSVWRLLVLGGFIVAIEMIPSRLTEERAGWLLVGCAIVTVTALGFFLFTTRRTAHELDATAGPIATYTAVRVSLRHLGLPVLALAFFLFWTFVYLGLWWFRPVGTFSALEAMPRFSDFFYYAVMTAFTAPPEAIAPLSRGARSATMIEILTGLALLTTYLSALFEWRRGAPARRPDPTPDERVESS
jgi:uncharacterized iron-regulated membrane protein